MDTNDSDEINVDLSPKAEVEVIDNRTPEPPSVKAPIPAIARSPITSVPTIDAHDRRKRFHLANAYHPIREEKLTRQASDPNPMISANKRLTEGFQLPKQHSEPGPLALLGDRKPSYLIEGPDESYFKVTCGSLEGKLIWQKFVCPGINVRCIRIDGRSHHELITPKELVKEANKQTLKDWKRAIRINSKMLRKLMDDNELDYYRHDIQCSNTCKSNKTQPQDSTGSSISRDSSMSSVNPSSHPSSFEENPSRPLQTQLTYEQRAPSFERNSSSEESPADMAEMGPVESGPMSVDTASTETIANCHRFWSVIKSSDMMDDVLKEIMNKIFILQRQSQIELRSEDAVILTNIVNSLDMMPQVQQIIRGQQDIHGQRSEAIESKLADLQTQYKAAQKEHQQNLERKRQLDVIDVIASKTAKKDGKKARIQKIGRQPAVDQQAQMQAAATAARFLPNSPHSMSPHALAGPFLVGPESLSAWHSPAAVPSYVINQATAAAAAATAAASHRQTIYSPHSIHSTTSDRLSDQGGAQAAAAHLAGHLSTCSIQSSPERPVTTRSPLPPK